MARADRPPRARTVDSASARPTRRSQVATVRQPARDAFSDPDHRGRVQIQVETREPDRAAATVAAVFPSMHLHLRRPSDPKGVLLRHDAVGDSTLSHQVIRIALGSRAVGDLSGQIVVGRARAGFAGVRVGRDELDTTGTFLYPLHRFETYWDEFDMELVVLHPDLVARVASENSDAVAHPVRFFGYEPISSQLGAHWRSVAHYVRSVLSQDSLIANPLVRGEAMRTAARAVLITFPNTSLGQQQRVRVVRSSIVDDAVSYIEAHAASDIALGDIARAAGAQPRNLITAFRSRLGSTPLQYLRETRYHRARADLLTGDPRTTTSVAEVAARWGFPHPGRFAGEYRRRFGESPGETLRRW